MATATTELDPNKLLDLALMADFCRFTRANDLPRLTGTAVEIREGERSRADYLDRFDDFLAAMVKQGEQKVASGQATEPQAVAALHKMIAMNEKILTVADGGWWDQIGVNFAGHPADDYKKMVYVLKFYSPLA